jgi:hypothetical protein
VFDEVHNAPEIISYLQQVVDERNTLGRFVLTASQHYTLQAHMSQSLAGGRAFVQGSLSAGL